MNTQEFAGATALITGGSRGIGRATAIALAQRGARVAVNYAANDAAAAETKQAIEALGGECILCKADVADPDAVKAMTSTALDALGSIEMLVTSAGIARVEEHRSMQFETFSNVMRTNVDGTYLPIMAVKDHMLERQRGAIVCIASIAGLRPRGRMIAYATSKAAVIALARNTAEAFAPDVRVNAVAPGLIETDMTADMDDALRASMIEQTFAKRIGRAEEIAETVAFLLSSRAGFITGQTLVVDGGRVTLP